MTTRRETTFRRTLLSLAALAGLALLLALAPGAAADGGLELAVADASEHGDSLAYQQEPLRWSFVVNNTGDAAVRFNLSLAVAGTAGWTLDPSLPDGTELAANASLAGNVTLVPAADALPGRYDLTLTAEPWGGGAAANASFAVEIPLPDLKISSVDFSHASAWIDNEGNTQTVTIYTTVVNIGGNIDSNGVFVDYIDVWFTGEGSSVEPIKYIDSLPHNHQKIVSIQFEPAKKGDLYIQVLVDAWNNQDGNDSLDVNIFESDEGNNSYASTIKVVHVSHDISGKKLNAVYPIIFRGEKTETIESEYTTRGTINGKKIDGNTWKITVIIFNPSGRIHSVFWNLKDESGTTVAEGTVAEIYGYYSEEGIGIVFRDNDYNGMVSPGDHFEIFLGEHNSFLSSINSIENYTFSLMAIIPGYSDTGFSGQPIPSPPLPVLFLTLALVALASRRQRH